MVVEGHTINVLAPAPLPVLVLPDTVQANIKEYVAPQTLASGQAHQWG